jgi:hypothetical protein
VPTVPFALKFCTHPLTVIVLSSSAETPAADVQTSATAIHICQCIATSAASTGANPIPGMLLTMVTRLAERRGRALSNHAISVAAQWMRS